MRYSRMKYLWLVLVGVLAIVSGYVFIEYIRSFSGEKILAAALGKTLAVFYFAPLGRFNNSFLTIFFWCFIILTLGWQRFFPAKPAQKIFSVSFAQDLVWFFYEAILQTLIVVVYVDLMIRYYNQHFSSLTITSLNQSPVWVRFLLALLLLDFLYWAQHYCNHKVPLFWRFHALHHSQKELNFFTDFRYHVLEYIVRHTFLVIPFLILKVNAPIIMAFVIFQRWYTPFYHGNIRTNLGPLKYILVTPQSHRVHHSLDAGHRDTNFGAIFSIWDFLLGTQCKDFEIYPETGIEDKGFPHEAKLGLKSLLLTPFYQLLYPFLNSGYPSGQPALGGGSQQDQYGSSPEAEQTLESGRDGRSRQEIGSEWNGGLSQPKV